MFTGIVEELGSIVSLEQQQDAARITVRGRPNPGLLSYCQQGTPFEVAEAHAAS